MRPYFCYFLDDHGAIVGLQVMVCADEREPIERPPTCWPAIPTAWAWRFGAARRVLLRTAEPRHA